MSLTSFTPSSDESRRQQGAADAGWSFTKWFTVYNSIGTFLLMALVSALLYGSLVDQLKSQYNRYLHEEIRDLEQMLRGEGLQAVRQKELSPAHMTNQFVHHYVRLSSRQGQVLLETPGMAELLPLRALPAPERSSRLIPGRVWRAAQGTLLVAGTWVELRSGDYSVLQVAVDLTAMEATLASYRAKIYLALVAGLCCTLLASYLIARRGTRPMLEMSEMVRRITATHLEERIQGKDWPRELNHLADATNMMLNRLEDSFRRLYLCATNLSHKLRTPLTILKGEAEVALSRRRSAAELEEVIASSLEEVERLSRLGESILFLANAEMGKFQMDRSLRSCRQEAEDVVDYYLPTAEDKKVTLTCQGDASVVADGLLFRKALAALISNGLTYSGPGAKVEIVFRQREGGAGEVVVTDTGCGIASTEVVKIFDRFYRIYGTRHMDPHGTGLGLCIVKAIMDLHDGTVSVQSLPGQGTTVTLCFPDPLLAPAAQTEQVLVPSPVPQRCPAAAGCLASSHLADVDRLQTSTPSTR